MIRRALAAASLLLALAVPARGDDPAPAGAPREHDFVPANRLDSVFVRADSLVAARGGAHAPNARLYLSWNRPWGMPGASAVRRPRCHDAKGGDTLYLCFLPGRTSVGFCSFTAHLYFRAVNGDTLGPFWHMQAGGENAGAMIAQAGPDSTFPQRTPWPETAYCEGGMEHTSRSAHVKVMAAVRYDHARPVIPDSIYTLARLVIRHARDLPGCDQPVCVEWANAQLGYWIHDEPWVNLGERFVTYGGDTKLCDQFRSAGPWTAPAKPVR